MRRFLATPATIIAVVLLAACAATSSASLSPSGGGPSLAVDPSMPLLVEGSFVDQHGARVAGATVTIEAHVQPGSPVWQQVTQTGPDGTFAFRVRPSPQLLGAAMGNGGYVNFDLSAIPPSNDSAMVGFWAFSRQPAGDAWKGEAPTMTLHAGGPGTT